MMMNSAAAFTIAKVLPFKPLCKPICNSSIRSSEKLREELNHLHSEADKTRDKANNARMRLLRLSEAAEKLQRQAAINVRTGKEDDARDLLFQKKQVIQALEKSKSRIELLDDLSAKLNEAIYVKESQLIGNIGMDLEVRAEDAPIPVRIVSSEQLAAEDSEETDVESKDMKLPEYEDLPPNEEDNATLANDIEQEALPCFEIRNEDEIFQIMEGSSSYEDFMEKLDRQLNTIEVELVTVLRISTVLLNDEDKQKNLRVQQIEELLDSIRHIRKRVSSMKLTNVNIR